jgi:formylmethanofuran dehydrogenase subunit E
MRVEFKPIGVIHSPYKTRTEAPFQGRGSENTCEVELYDEYQEGATDIEGFSHLLVVYFFHQSRGCSLLVKTSWDKFRHGVFTTRSPDRPNPMGICVVRLLSRDGKFLKVKGLDAVDGSPLLDIKPYIPDVDQAQEPKLGWLEHKFKLNSQRLRGNPESSPGH